jgi:purine-binding chemotaxis protein CheW
VNWRKRSATAAKDIKGLIDKSGEEVKSGVTLVRESTGEALEQDRRACESPSTTRSIDRHRIARSSPPASGDQHGGQPDGPGDPAKRRHGRGNHRRYPANNNVANSGYLEIISFHLGKQVFCVNIMSVREIRGWAPSTTLPHSPPHVLGVINLRGSVIPVIDMAIRLGLPAIKPTERSAIIVTNIAGKLVGLLVENVSDMITVNNADLQPAPDVLPAAERALTRAIIPVDEQMICYLDLDALFSTDEELAA